MARPAVLHLGLGAFFRAFGLPWIQQAGGWDVVGVSLRSPKVRDLLQPQNWAYHAISRDPGGDRAARITVLRDVLVGPEAPDRVLGQIADPNTHVITLTITEKGYGHDPETGRLNPDHPQIAADLTGAAPQSAPGVLVQGLALRQAKGSGPITILSCDNLPDNGQVLQAVVQDLAGRIAPDLVPWLQANVTFPCTMVDRIVPATTPADLASLTLPDAAPVFHEPYRHWVIEDRFAGPMPDLARVGVRYVPDVRPYEHMKLRMLNGTHSALAYCGVLSGLETVAEASTDLVLGRFIDALWQHEIQPSFTAPDGVDLTAYADALRTRYHNPRIRHRTAQIAMDGTQKLPQRILAPLQDGLRAGRPVPGLITVVAAWMQYVTGRTDAGDQITVDDPRADDIAAITRGLSEPEALVSALLDLPGLVPKPLAAQIAEPLIHRFAQIRKDGLYQTLQKDFP